MSSNVKRKQHTRQKQGWAAQEEYRVIAHTCSVGTGKAKAQLELKLVRDMTGSKRGFSKYISSKIKKNVVPLLLG